MNQLKVYQYNKCSTCRKALKWLEKKGIPFESLDITTTPPDKKELQQMIASLGGEFKKLFNTSGVQYRELKIADKLKKGMSEKEAIDLLVKNGRLVKRPFVAMENGKKGLIGFKEDEWRAFFK